jgi:signal peptidase I
MGAGVRHYRSPSESSCVTTETAILETPAKVAKPKTNWFHEAHSIFWLIMAVLGFHSFIAKPFYIPSESMVPGLRVGDRLVVSKFAYGWSFVSPTVPNPSAIFKSLVLREAACSAACPNAATS